jgi:hypothetical protein
MQSYSDDEIAQFMREAADLYHQNQDIEEALRFLKERTHIGKAIIFTSEVLNLPISEAQALVLNSDTWSEERPIFEQSMEMFWLAVEELSRETMHHKTEDSET